MTQEQEVKAYCDRMLIAVNTMRSNHEQELTTLRAEVGRLKTDHSVLLSVANQSQVEVERLTKENKELEEENKQILDGVAHVEMIDFKKDERLDFSVQGNGARMAVEVISAMFFLNGAVNYLDVQLCDKDGNEFIVTIQKRDGKTAHELKEDALASIIAERKAIAEAVEEWLVAPLEKGTKASENLASFKSRIIAGEFAKGGSDGMVECNGNPSVT